MYIRVASAGQLRAEQPQGLNEFLRAIAHDLERVSSRHKRWQAVGPLCREALDRGAGAASVETGRAPVQLALACGGSTLNRRHIGAAWAKEGLPPQMSV
jgi:hypothetical protein